MVDFCHLHVHSSFSFLDGYGLPHQILSRVREIGHKAIAITDHGNIWSHTPFWMEQKKNYPEINFIPGCEFYFVDDATDKTSRKRYHITVMAKNSDGLVNLHKLNNKAYFDGFYYKPRIDWHDLAAYGRNLVVLSGCTGSGLLIQHLDDPEYIEKCMAFGKKHFGDDFYIEISPINKYKEQVQKMITIAKEYGVKAVSTTDAHFPTPKDYVAEDLMVCIGTKATYNDPSRLKLMPELYLFDGIEAEQRGKEIYGDGWQEYFENTLEIASKCNVERILSGQKQFPLPDKYETAESYLEHQIQIGITKRELEKLPNWVTEYKPRIDYELNLILNKGFANYLLMIQDLILWAKQRMLVGAARGSVAGSLVAYVLEITEVDPIPFGLMFERFIDITRYDPPDIDIDFPDEKRHIVFDYIEQKYGSDYVSQFGTISYFKPKIALWDVRRAYNLPFKEAGELAKLTIERSSADARATFCLNDTFAMFDRSKAILKQYPLFKNAAKLEGQIRQTGVHAAAVIVSEKPLIEIAGSVPGKNKTGHILCIDKHSSEELGLLKIDVLGLKQLTIFENILTMINKPYEWLYKLPLDDEKTFKVLQQHRFCGIFQFEGDAVKMVSKQVNPDSFINVSEISALARPGALHCGGTTKYIEFRAWEKGYDNPNKKKPYYEHPLLKELAGDTYGIVIYQEQVLKILTQLGRMDWKDSADLRKGMSKSKGVEFFNQYKDKFLTGAAENGVDPEAASHIWDNVCTFGSWAFNKSHSVSYGLLSYWCAYLKANYPDEFYVCTLQKENDTEAIKKIIREWVEIGGKFQIFDIEKSGINFTIHDDGIYGGWTNIKGIGEKQAKKILSAKPWKNSTEFRKIAGKKICSILKTIKQLPSLKQGNQQLLSFFENSEFDNEDNWADIPESESSIDELLPWANLYPIGKEFSKLYEIHNLTKINEITEKTTDVKMIGKISSLNLRDIHEAGIEQNRDTSKIKDKHLTEFLIMQVDDDTGQILAGINRYLFPRFRKMIFEDAGVGAIIGFSGKKAPGFNKINIEKLKIIKPAK